MTAPAVVITRKPLTERHIQMLTLLAQGFSRGQIAHELGVADSTVASALGRAYRRLGVTCARDAVAIAIRTGLIPATTAGDNA